MQFQVEKPEVRAQLGLGSPASLQQIKPDKDDPLRVSFGSANQQAPINTQIFIWTGNIQLLNKGVNLVQNSFVQDEFNYSLLIR